MKLLVIFPSMERGGAEGYALTIARGAVKQGHAVAVASPSAPGTAGLVQDFCDAGAVWHALSIGRAATIFGRRPRFLVPWIEFYHALRLLRSLRPGVLLIVLPGPAACFAVQMAAAIVGIPAASCFQLTPRVAWQPTSLRRVLLQWARHQRQAWISVSEHNRDFVSRAFGMPSHDVHVIHNGAPMSPAMESPERARADCRAEMGLGSDARILVTVARLGVQKAHVVLLESIPTIIEKHPDVCFVWIGEGEQRASLEKRVAELGLEAHVRLMGFRTDIPRWLGAADVFVFPTHYEGLPFSLVEAMAAGLPVVASSVSSIPEVLDHGKAGLLVEQNTAEAWGPALLSLLDDPTEAFAMGARGRARAALYSEATMVEQTLELLQQLAEPGA